MRLPRPFYRLPLRFDVARLRAEVTSLPRSAWVSHPTDFAGNTSLRLISVGGEENDDLRGPMAATAHLAASPYLRQVLASFGVVWSRSRLMRLAPGAQVPEHADASYHWYNRVRVHIPVLTRPEVRFHCGGETVHMAAGEAWVFDNWRRHSVDNGSPEERIHLVADTTGTAAFWALIGSSDAASGDRFVAFRPEIDARVATERTAPRPVMAPAEVELLLGDFLGELVVAEGCRDASPHLDRYVGLLNGFLFDWRQLYLLYGEDPAGRAAYDGVLQGLREATKPIASGLVMRTNGFAAQAVLESRLLQHVLRLDEIELATPARMSNGPHKVRTSASLPERPLFIVAAPRSGSTLLFETLAASTQLCTVGGEAHWLVEQFAELRPGAPGVDSNRLEATQASQEFAAPLASSLWSRMIDAGQRPLDPGSARHLRWLEKTPKNALRIPFLERYFPDAQFLFLWRDPRDNLGSLIDAWQAGGWVTYPDLEGWDGPWSMALPPGWQAMRGRPLEEVAAFQWRCINSTVLDDLAQRPAARWAAVSYEEFVDAPAATVRGICRFAGIDFDAALAARVAGALPISRHTLTAPAPGKWRRHEQAIERVLPTLEPIWQRLRALPTLTGRNDSQTPR